jgi:hypothetical protein
MTLVNGSMLETRLLVDVWEEMLLAVLRIAVILLEFTAS